MKREKKSDYGCIIYCPLLPTIATLIVKELIFIFTSTQDKHRLMGDEYCHMIDDFLTLCHFPLYHLLKAFPNKIQLYVNVS